MTIIVNIALLVGLFLSGNAGPANSPAPGQSTPPSNSTAPNDAPWPTCPTTGCLPPSEMH